MFGINTDPNVGLNVKPSLKLSNLNENRYGSKVPINITNAKSYGILELFHAYRRTDVWLLSIYIPVTDEDIQGKMNAMLIAANIKNIPWVRAIIFLEFLNIHKYPVTTHRLLQYGHFFI
jgi:hypothetical protein